MVKVCKSGAIACGLALIVGLLPGLAQTGSQRWLTPFEEASKQNLDDGQVEQVLENIFGSEGEVKRARDSYGAIVCTVTDPTGTPLNVRSVPNGPQIVTTLDNGRQVLPYQAGNDEQGRPWIQVGDSINSWGWVYAPYVSCLAE